MAGDDVESESLARVPKVGDLGRYRLIAELSRGGMGIVYLALVRGPGGFNKLFVVKELKAHLAEDRNLVSMFLEEARLAAKLNHPNVVQTIETGSDGGRHFIAMEFLEGQSYNRFIRRLRRTGPSLPLHYHLHVIIHLLEGLRYTHGATDFDGTPLGLVHRDVSPHNAFITYEGQVKLLDFGIAKALASTQDTRSGVLKGKVSYMAPEQASGLSLDHRADLFSIGVMLWEAAVGQRMWSHVQSDLQILHALIHGTIPPPRDAKPDIDPALERMILKACAIEPEDRYQNGAELQYELEGHMKQMGLPSFGARDLGRHLSEVFSAERAQVKAVIEDQLRLLSGVPSGHYATIDLPLLNASSSVPSGTPSGVLLSNPTPSDPPFPKLPLLPSFRSTSDRPTAERITAPLFALRTAPSRRTLAVVAAAGLAVIAGVGALVLRPARPKVVASASSPPPAPSPTQAPASEPVHAFVAVSPREAQIAIDDGVPQTGPLAATFPRDGKTHAIRVEAARYEAKVLGFVADRDHTFDISLEPVKDEAAAPAAIAHTHVHAHAVVRTGAPTEPAPSAPAAAPSAQPEPQPSAPQPGAPQPGLPGAKTRPKQQIDTKDPYAN